MLYMKKLSLFLFFILYVLQASAQGQIFGTIQSASDTMALPGATVLLFKCTDQAKPQAVMVTDLDGKFRFERISPGPYKVKVNYVGYKTYSKQLSMKEAPINLGVLWLQEESNALREVQIVGRQPLGEQMGDTTQFNAAAFKTSPNASAEDLVQKMPGISVQDGKIQAQGEDVQEILVDGKRFFEGDVDAALRNLPAEVIANIQIFEKKSEQAEFSGFDDGKRTKTINIVTKPNRRRGQFGQASVGYGTDERYMAGASVNFFSGDRRITATGVRNNINMSDYSIGETPGGGMRGRRGNNNGIVATNRLGLNYNDEWGEKIEVSGNYHFDHKNNRQGQYQSQDYILPSDSGRVYTQNSRSTSTDISQRLRMRMKYDIDDRNQLLFKPNVTIQQKDGYTYFLGRTVNDYNPVNQTESNSNSEATGYNFEGDVHYRHRFAKKGRTFSTSLNTQYNSDKENNYRVAENIFYQSADPYETLDQFTNNYATGYSWEVNASFTEPLSKQARLQLEYKINNREEDADRRTYSFQEQTDDYSLLDTVLSNTFISDYTRQDTEVGYQYNTDKLRLQVEAQYQRADMQNDQDFPTDYEMDRTFQSFLPSAEVEYKFSKTRNLRLEYRTNTKAPSLSQLQDVIDNSNPLHIRTGNPNLKQSYENRVNIRFRNFNPETNKVFFIGMNGTVTRNNISNSTIVAEAPIHLSEKVVVEQGSQITQPINLDKDSWNLRTYFNYGQPVHMIESNISLSGSLGYSRRPGVINQKVNISNSTNLRLGVSVSSNISENVDFNLSTHSNYNLVENSLMPERNNNYFNQSTQLRSNLVFGKGIVYRTELNHQLNTGLSAGYDNSYLLWNMSISKRLFNNERGEVSLSVNDLLEQNSNINRNVTELYVEDTQSDILQRYFMLTFTYSIRHYIGG